MIKQFKIMHSVFEDQIRHPRTQILLASSQQNPPPAHPGKPNGAQSVPDYSVSFPIPPASIGSLPCVSFSNGNSESESPQLYLQGEFPWVADRRVDVPVEVVWVNSRSRRWNSCHDDDLGAKKIRSTRGTGNSRDWALGTVHPPQYEPKIPNRMCRIGNVGGIGIGASLDLGKDNWRGNRGCIVAADKPRPGSAGDLGMQGGEFDEPCCIAVEAEFVDVVEQGIGLLRVIQGIVVAEMRIIEDRMNLEATQVCLDASREMAPWGPEVRRRLIRDCVGVYAREIAFDYD